MRFETLQQTYTVFGKNHNGSAKGAVVLGEDLSKGEFQELYLDCVKKQIGIFVFTSV